MPSTKSTQSTPSAEHEVNLKNFQKGDYVMVHIYQGRNKKGLLVFGIVQDVVSALYPEDGRMVEETKIQYKTAQGDVRWAYDWNCGHSYKEQYNEQYNEQYKAQGCTK